MRDVVSVGVGVGAWVQGAGVGEDAERWGVGGKGKVVHNRRVQALR